MREALAGQPRGEGEGEGGTLRPATRAVGEGQGEAGVACGVHAHQRCAAGGLAVVVVVVPP